jgi:heme/copper-type cytochrome/quinol oxidase subunit 3
VFSRDIWKEQTARRLLAFLLAFLIIFSCWFTAAAAAAATSTNDTFPTQQHCFTVNITLLLIVILVE